MVFPYYVLYSKYLSIFQIRVIKHESEVLWTIIIFHKPSCARSTILRRKSKFSNVTQTVRPEATVSYASW